MRAFIVSKSPDSTRSLGELLGRRLEGLGGFTLLFLEGDLGSGKTLFTKGVYAGFAGGDPDEVVSPSYTIVNVYGDARSPFHHVDLYRLESVRQLQAMEYEEFLFAEGGVTVVEWPRFAAELVPPAEPLWVRFSRLAEPGIRELVIESDNERHAPLIAAMEAAC